MAFIMHLHWLAANMIKVLIYSKHVEDIYWSKFKKKVHLVDSYYANYTPYF